MAISIMKILPAAISLALITAGIARAGDSRWIRLGPMGGPIGALATDPIDPQTLYATTSHNVWKSTNGGGHWISIFTGLTAYVDDVVIDPTNSRTLYLGTLWGGVIKSTDGGGNWTASGLAGIWVEGLAVDPISPGTIYARTNCTFAPCGLFKSTDGGANWIQRSGGMGGVYRDNITALAVDPLTPETLYAGTYYAGLFKSTNGGIGWSAINTGLTDLLVSAVAIDPTTPRTLYRACREGIFKSTDGGGNWNPANTSLQFRSHIVNALAIDPSSPQTLYAGTRDGGVFKSTNGGGNWSAANAGLTSLWVNAFAFDSSNARNLYAGTAGGLAGVFKSTNGGADWSSVNTGLTGTGVSTLAIDPLNVQTLFAFSDSLIKSTNGGDNWTDANPSLNFTVAAIAIDPTAPQILYAGGDDGVFKSTNGGDSWSAINTGITLNSVWCLAVDPTNSQILYAGSDGRGVFKSTNGGDNWTDANAGGLATADIRVLAIDPTASQTLYAGTDGGGLFKSTDGGGNWKAVNSGMTSPQVRSLAINRTDPRTLYVCTGDGFFMSRNGGGDWSALELASGIRPYGVRYVLLDPQDPTAVYVATEGGILLSFTSAVDQVPMTLPAGGAGSTSTLGPAGTLAVGFASINGDAGSTPYGTAVFSYRQNGVVVSEAGVPASPPITAARFLVDYRSNQTVHVLTGFAAVNPYSTTANLKLKLLDSNGAILAQGNIRLARFEHLAKLLDQLAPEFVLPPLFLDNGLGSLEITGDQPVSVLALRLTINQRGDVLMTSIPVADVSRPAPSGTLSFPQIADGGGYQTTLILMNTSGTLQTGLVVFYDNNGLPLAVRMTGAASAGTQFPYSIPVGGFLHLVTDGSSSAAAIGWAQLIPDGGTTAPVSAAIFGFAQGGILVTEAGVPAVAATTHARIYVDKSGGHDTGVAVANPGIAGMRITATTYQPDGMTLVGSGSAVIDLASLGHDARFAGQLIAGLPEGFTGVLDLASTTPFAVLTLRALRNARGDFLVTTFPVADVNQAPPIPLIFPQIANGAGYQTQIILLNTGDTASSVTVSYFGNDGSPIAVGRDIPRAAAPGAKR